MRPPTTLLFVALLPACLASPPGKDFDGDGYTFDEDCNDTVAAINPGAQEQYYDGVDQNCDGASDFDKDGDGHDSDAYDGADCDDSEDTVFPGATDVWYDGVDQDCDGANDYDQDGDGIECQGGVSEGCPGQHGGEDCDDTLDDVYPGADDAWYDGVDQDCGGENDYDQDGDGFECQGGSVGGCPHGHVGTDCDDTRADIHPDALELVDGVDNNCDGAEDEVPWKEQNRDPSTLHRGLFGQGTPYAGFGFSISSTGRDVVGPQDKDDKDELQPDNDGLLDFLVSAPMTAGASRQGVYLIYGGSPGALEVGDVRDVTVLRIESDNDDWFGITVDWVDDLDGDARPEILVGGTSPDFTARGSAHLFASQDWAQAGQSYTDSTDFWFMDTEDATASVSGGWGDGYFGRAVGLGDVSGGGLGDFAVGDPQTGATTIDGEGLVWAGATRIFMGEHLDDSGLVEFSGDHAHASVVGDAAGWYLGVVEPILADPDQNGADEILVSTIHTSGGLGVIGSWADGTPVAQGDSRGVSELDARIHGSEDHAQLGLSMAADGDPSGDGYPELIATAVERNGGLELLVLDGDRVKDIEGSVEVDGLILAVIGDLVVFDDYPLVPITMAGDFNQDGYDDIAFGNPTGELMEFGGYAAVIYGRPQLAGEHSALDPESSFAGSDEWLLAYGAVAAIDVDSAGTEELLLGAPWAQDSSSSSGDVPGGVFVLDPLLGW